MKKILTSLFIIMLIGLMLSFAACQKNDEKIPETTKNDTKVEENITQSDNKEETPKVNTEIKEENSEHKSSGRDMTTVIEMMLEGYLEEVDARLYESDSYSIYLPNDSFTAYPEDGFTKFAFNLNDETWFEISESADKTIDEVETELKEKLKDYTFEESTNEDWKYYADYFADNNNYLAYKIFEGENGIVYTFLIHCPLEAIEGSGTQFIYVLNTFLTM